MNKGREKSGRNEERERGGFIPLFSHPQLSRLFFLCSLLYAPPPLSERLEQAILALEESSVSARNKDTKNMVVWFKGAELRAIYRALN